MTARQQERNAALDAAKVRANRLALVKGEPYAVIAHGSGFRAVSMMKVPGAVSLHYMTATPEEWNRKAGY